MLYLYRRRKAGFLTLPRKKETKRMETYICISKYSILESHFFNSSSRASRSRFVVRLSRLRGGVMNWLMSGDSPVISSPCSRASVKSITSCSVMPMAAILPRF